MSTQSYVIQSHCNNNDDDYSPSHTCTRHDTPFADRPRVNEFAPSAKRGCSGACTRCDDCANSLLLDSAPR